MFQYVQTKLPSFLCSIKLGLSRRRQELKILHQTPQSDAKQRQSKDDSRAAPPPNTERKVPEVIPISLHFGLLLQEPLRPELFRVLPMSRVVGEPPCVHKDLALCRDVEATELRVVEVHVWDEEGNRHSEAKSFLDHSLQVWELVGVWLCDLVSWSKNSVNFISNLVLDLWVVHKLSNAPFN